MERNYYRELTNLLEKGGILDKHRDICLPSELIGLKFRFQAEWGSHFEVVTGQILGIAYSDEGGVQIEVSPKRFGGLPLICFMYTEERWCAYLDLSIDTSGSRTEKQVCWDLEYQFRAGTLELC